MFRFALSSFNWQLDFHIHLCLNFKLHAGLVCLFVYICARFARLNRGMELSVFSTCKIVSIITVKAFSLTKLRSTIFFDTYLLSEALILAEM